MHNKLKSVSHFKNNEQVGEYVAYYEDGSLREKGQYVAGKKNGKFYFYDEKGKVTKTERYKNGEKK